MRERERESERESRWTREVVVVRGERKEVVVNTHTGKPMLDQHVECRNSRSAVLQVLH